MTKGKSSTLNTTSLSSEGFSTLSAIDLDDIGQTLHRYAAQNNKKNVKKLIKLGIAVDFHNQAGQTPLFSACFEGSQSAAECLLKNGADPNMRSVEGSTPVHAAGYSGNPKLLSKLVEAGGDLRLHDKKGRTVKDWVLCQPDQKKRKKMLEFMEETKHVALSNSGKDLLHERQTLRRDGLSLSSLLGLRHRLKTLSLASVQSLGYGKVYFGGGEQMGSIATIPMIHESLLKHDEFGCTYTNGPFMVMESMTWQKVMVTVKRLHREPPEGGTVDLLIREHEHMVRLHHPNILLLMGLCQTNNLEGLVLIYERVGCGSLYTHLYQRVETVDTFTMCEILRQICDALIYLHQQNLLHTAISSHSIQLVSTNLAKLGNFEYMVENVRSEGHGPFSKVTENKYLNAMYNWLAPEVLAGEPVSEKSDLYGLVSVLWEILNGQPPWSGMPADDIRLELVENHNGLDINSDIKRPFDVLLKYGLNVEPKGRALTVDKLKELLAKVVVEHDSLGITGDTPHPLRTRVTGSKLTHKTQAPLPPLDRKQSAVTRRKVGGSSTNRQTQYSDTGEDEVDGFLIPTNDDKTLNASLEKYAQELLWVSPEEDTIEETVVEKTMVENPNKAIYSSIAPRQPPKGATPSVSGASVPSSHSARPSSSTGNASVQSAPSSARKPASVNNKSCLSPIRSVPGPLVTQTGGTLSTSTGPAAPLSTSSPRHKGKPTMSSDSDTAPERPALPRGLSPRTAYPGSESDTPPPLPDTLNPALLEALQAEGDYKPVSSLLQCFQPDTLASGQSYKPTTPPNPFKKDFSKVSGSDDKLFKELNNKPPPMSRFYSTTNAYLNSLNRRSSEEAKSQPTVYGILLREYANHNSVPRPYMAPGSDPAPRPYVSLDPAPCPYLAPSSDSGDSARRPLEPMPSMTELKSAPGSTKHPYSREGLSPPTPDPHPYSREGLSPPTTDIHSGPLTRFSPTNVQANRSNMSNMSSSFSNRSGQSWSTSYKDSDSSYKPASHRDGLNTSPSKGVYTAPHPIFGIPRPAVFPLKPGISEVKEECVEARSTPGSQVPPKPTRSTPHDHPSAKRKGPSGDHSTPQSQDERRKSCESKPGIFKPTLLSMIRPGEVKLKPIPAKEPIPATDTTSQSEGETPRSGKKKSPGRKSLSPGQAKKKFIAAGKSIRDMISSFQSHANEHFKKQAILQLKSKKRPSGVFSDNIEQMKSQMAPHTTASPGVGKQQASSPALTEGRQPTPSTSNTAMKQPAKSVSAPVTNSKQGVKSAPQKQTEKKFPVRITPNITPIKKVIPEDPTARKVLSNDVQQAAECQPSETKTSFVNIQLHRVAPLGPQHIQQRPSPLVVDCPSQNSYVPQRTCSVHSTTDSEVSAVVRRTILSAHKDVVTENTAPACPHRDITIATAKEQLARRREPRGFELAHSTPVQCVRSEEAASPDTNSSLSVKPTHSLSQAGSPSSTGRHHSHSSATISVELRPSRGHTPGPSRGHTPGSWTSLGLASSHSALGTNPLAQPHGSDRAESSLAVEPNALHQGAPQREEDEVSLTSSPPRDDIEEIYFDDELSSDLLKEKHMRLQNTLVLDNTGELFMTEDKPLFGDGRRDTSTPYNSDVEQRDRRGSGEPHTNSPLSYNKKEDTDNGYHGDNNSSPSSESEDHDTVDGDMPGVVNIEKHLNRSEEEGFTTTVTVRSDGSGQHTITHKKTDITSGNSKTTYKTKVKAAKVITKVIVDDDRPIAV